MDRLRADDIEQARSEPPGERLHRALEMMAQGIEIKRANLRRQHPTRTADEIQALLERWLSREDD